MKDELSRIYFDDLPVRLLGDEARPPLSRIVRAGGKVPGRVDVLVLASPQDLLGHPLAAEEIIDRTVEPTKPIYLRSVPKANASSPPPATLPSPISNVDPVIAQLGVEPRYRTPVAPSQMGTTTTADADDKALALAEAEAEQRQEEDREQDGSQQDDQDDERDARDDLDGQD
ncbi:MAG: hypothetical protein AABY18_07835 [Candidatus Thermoplasmatota archaeon]